MERNELLELSNDQLIDIILEQQSDLKKVKNTVIRIAKFIGYMDENGQVQKSFSLKKISSLVMRGMTNPDGLMNEFGDVSEIISLMNKYEHL